MKWIQSRTKRYWKWVNNRQFYYGMCLNMITRSSELRLPLFSVVTRNVESKYWFKIWYQKHKSHRYLLNFLWIIERRLKWSNGCSPLEIVKLFNAQFFGDNMNDDVSFCYKFFVQFLIVHFSGFLFYPIRTFRTERKLVLLTLDIAPFDLSTN